MFSLRWLNWDPKVRIWKIFLKINKFSKILAFIKVLIHSFQMGNSESFTPDETKIQVDFYFADNPGLGSDTVEMPLIRLSNTSKSLCRPDINLLLANIMFNTATNCALMVSPSKNSGPLEIPKRLSSQDLPSLVKNFREFLIVCRWWIRRLIPLLLIA